MATKLFTSKFSEDVISKLSKLLILEKRTVARIAFSISLNTYGKNVEKNTESLGTEFNKTALIGEENIIFYKSLLEIVYGEPIGEDDFFGNYSYVKYHIDAGCKILYNDFHECKEDKNEFLIKLSKYIQNNIHGNKGIQDSKDNDIFELNLLIGKDEIKGNDLFIELSNNGKYKNSHLAIMGTTGAGKTQILLNLLAQIREKSEHTTNFIFLDYKGDIYKNDKFIDITKSEVINFPEDILSINPFILDNYSENSINIVALEKANLFSSITRQFGPVQKGNFQDVIKRCYKKRENEEIKYPDLKEVYKELQDFYEEKNIKIDTLSETLRNLSDFNLFWSHDSGKELIDKIYNKTMVINLNDLPEANKDLVSFLVIEKLYKDMSYVRKNNLSSINKDGHRKINTILVIDEAHNYLNKKTKLLEKLIRESRDAGIFVFFASQSPSDYEQEDFDFKELLGFKIILQCNDVSSSSIKKLLPVDDIKADHIRTKIPKLNTLNGIINSLDSDTGYKFFIGDKFADKY